MPLPRKAAAVCTILAALATWLSMGCSLPEQQALREPVSCSLTRLVRAQRLFQAARASMVRHYEERSASSLNAAYYFAGDAVVAARSTRNCRDFDRETRAAALNLIRMSGQLRSLALSTMRDPDDQVAVTLLQEQYSEVFRGRDIE